METKKSLIVLILKILETESDNCHPIKQTMIANIISKAMPCDRKTVGRNILFLQKMGYPIVKTTKGFYLDKKKFSVEETRFILSAIHNAQGKSEEEKNELIERLKNILAKIYRT